MTRAVSAEEWGQQFQLEWVEKKVETTASPGLGRQQMREFADQGRHFLGHCFRV